MLLTREQLQDRLIALHRASLELVKDVSLETLLERIANVACEQANARYAALGVLDEGGKLKQFISVGVSEDQIKRIPHPPVGEGLIGALMNAEGPIRLPDIEADPRSVGFPPHHPVMHSFLGVPIRAGERQLGQIYLTEKIEQPEFTDDDEKIIQMLAAYAAVAIQNARLYESLRERDRLLTRRNEDLALLNDIASTLTASLELDEILNKTLALVMNYVRVEAGEIFLLEDDRETLRLVLHRGQAAEAFWTRNRFRLDEGFIGIAASSGEPVVSRNLAGDIRFLRDAVVEAGFHQIACLPLKSTENIMGVLSIATRSKTPLDESDIQLLTAVCNWAGLAIENARLHNDARRLAILEERDRIGMDLHDGVIQAIFGVGLSLENAMHLVDENPGQSKERLQQAIDNLNQTIRDIRTYILDLRPRQLGSRGLLEGLKQLTSEHQANTLSEAILTGPRRGLEGLPNSHSLALFHICQEALANVAKHAGARSVNVDVWSTPQRILLEVRDDGRGFDPEKVNANLGHGLTNMVSRARTLGGDVEITSTPGEGTSILAWLPHLKGGVEGEETAQPAIE
jgi:two-component system, NarL family, sensor histidine kinase DevS